ncbi:PRC-barrel domain-containing protein [Pollutimonas sp. M17]|uniref:PRC-barrel domain-containing protein n=1 Tax=Pollutimonas sp. M17 TaxID=2962065 RepID=UPI0021F487A0|nr:PRC-barrel domain-containing protein [Pollutimonas sp. M17]UYO94668.1 PRC-barrel domain-containing protein [Pollutimonas sp. M17]HWK69468.1 PRC-barrel domain-containing protein [Burkholderiaceae bacterium]
MKKSIAIAACSLPLVFSTALYAQTPPPQGGDAPAPGAPGTPAPAPTTPPAAPSGGAADTSASADMTEAITGWSVKDKIMGNAVYNEKDEKIGDINDVVLASDGKAAYFIVGAGGFLGMGERSVAIPFDEIQQTGDKLVLPGYTKDQLKALPKVEVAK